MYNTAETRIDNEFVREHFQWDLVCEIDWDLVKNNYDSANRALDNFNPDTAKVNIDHLEEVSSELYIFLMLNAPQEYLP